MPATKATPTFCRVLIDYGHGGFIAGKYQTAGKRYTFTGKGWTAYEGVINRAVAFRLIRLLLTAKISVIDVVAARAAGDLLYPLSQRDVPLADRVRHANSYRSGSSLLLSLHGNAVGNALEGPSQAPRGACFYTSKGQTLSDKVADTIHAAFTAHPGIDTPIRRGDLSDGDTDYEADFYVLRKTRCPAVLGEVGFFTNIEDARWMMSDAGAQATAEAYFNGIKPWLV